jgi:Ca-activated chloride channel homolog
MPLPLAFALLILSAPTAFMQSAGVFRARANLVVMQVTVTTPAGGHVADLEAEDFIVFEDGVRQTVTEFARAEEPIALSLLLDTSASMDDAMALAQKAAIGFTRRLKPTDLAQVVSFHSDVQVLQGFTRDQAQLEAAIRQTTANGTTKLYNALYVALRELEAVRATRADIRRHAIVVLSDGADTSSVVGFDDVFDLARQSNVGIYTIGLGGATGEANRVFNDGAAVLRQFARATGGRAIFVERASQLAPVYNQIADELASQYTIAYVPSAGRRDGKWHDITVKVNRQNHAARTRAGYLAAH